MSSSLNMCWPLFVFSVLLSSCISAPLDQIVLPVKSGVGLPEGSADDGFLLPVFDTEAIDRVQEIRTNREGYLYGPPLLGNTSVFPIGVLGEAMVRRDKAMWFRDVSFVTDKVNNHELPKAARTLAEAGGLQNLSSYSILYDGQWESSIPDGISPGSLSNWTQDLFFSMERLSTNPYAIWRLHPHNDKRPFEVDSRTVKSLTDGLDLEALHEAGRLFVVDHSVQKEYPTNSGRFTAACTAYFYIHPKSGDLLPLAIRTDPDSDLVYTPADSEHEWMFAKMAFEMNDLFHSQNYHLAATHDVCEPVHQAALRTLSKRHPVRGYLDRLMYQAYAVRPIGDEVLFNDGGFFDQSFAINNIGGRRFAGYAYPRIAGLFRSSQFYNNLQSRGLLNNSYGPELKAFPFLDDAQPMYDTIHAFATAYVDAYYDHDTMLLLDAELQTWILEAHQGAHVLDFPPFPLASKAVLADTLAHVAFLAGVAHHVQNSATAGESSGLLPLHPSAFFRPVPQQKGTIGSERELMTYLHNDTEALKQASLLVRFNRPLLLEQKGDLTHMWAGEDFLRSVVEPVRKAAVAFERAMTEISDRIMGKSFDEEGLCQGMPMIWKCIAPEKIPYYLSV